MSSSVHQANISGSKLKKYPIITPPLKEQKKLVGKIQNVENEKKKIEDVYKQKLGALGELKQSLLQKAFTGELTADWRKQHPTTNAL